MLLVADVKAERRKVITDVDIDDIEALSDQVRSDIPAVTHVDYSARLHTVDKSLKPDLHEILSKLHLLTGHGIVVNTSFNIRGEPIVCTPEDAYRCFMETELDILVLENNIMFKEKQHHM
jgi:carbamoyltransferase